MITVDLTPDITVNLDQKSGYLSLTQIEPNEESEDEPQTVVLTRNDFVELIRVLKCHRYLDETAR